MHIAFIFICFEQQQKWNAMNLQKYSIALGCTRRENGAALFKDFGFGLFTESKYSILLSLTAVILLSLSDSVGIAKAECHTTNRNKTQNSGNSWAAQSNIPKLNHLTVT
jgi:hypothetical protein